MREGKLRLMVVGTTEGIVMIEAGANEVEEDAWWMPSSLRHGEIKKICAAIRECAQKVGKPKREVSSRRS